MGRFSARVAAAGIGAGAGAASSSSAAAAAAAGGGAGEPYDAEEAVFLHNLVWLSYLDADGPGGEKCLEHRPAWMRAGGTASGVPSLRAALRNGAVAAGAGGGRGALRLLEFCEHRETDTQAYFAATEVAPSEVVLLSVWGAASPTSTPAPRCAASAPPPPPPPGRPGGNCGDSCTCSGQGSESTCQQSAMSFISQSPSAADVDFVKVMTGATRRPS